MEPQGDQGVNMDNLELELQNVVDDARRTFVLGVVFSIQNNLRLLAKHCSVKTLKNFRLVSREWHQTSLESWREKATIRINIGQETSEHSVGEMDYLRMVRQNNDDSFQLRQFPFQYYKLIGPWFNPCKMTLLRDPELSEPRERLMDAVGPYMAHVHFYRLEIKLEILEKLKNVESLVFEECFFPLHVVGEGQPICSRLRMLKIENVYGYLYSESFFMAFPLLQDLTWYMTIENTVQVANFYQELGRLQRDANGISFPLKSLKTLKSNHKLDGLVEARISLEQLSLNVMSGSEDQLREVLLGTPTLKSLTLYRSPKEATIQSFPFHVEMDQMEQLYLLGRVTTAFNFLKFMPSLKKVVVDQLCVERSEDVPDEPRNLLKSCDFVQNACFLNLGVTMNNLEHLEIDSRLAIESWNTLTDCMPNLKVLKAVLDNKTFRLVCQHWPKLDALKVCFGSKVDEKGITGIGESRDDAVCLPNLTDLQELGVFELMAYCGESCITDFSVRHAFMRMKSLIKLNICVSSKFTMDAVENLNRKIIEVNIYRNYGSESKQHEHANSEIHCCTTMRKVFS